MKYLYGAGILILVCTCSSCLKRLLGADPRPAVFECHIGGLDFVPDKGFYYIVPPYGASVHNYGTSYYIHIFASVYPNNQPAKTIDMTIQNVTGPGVYEFNDTLMQRATYSNGGRLYVAYKAGHGSVTLTGFDANAKMIQGTFWFNGSHRMDVNDTMKVTNGHFNMKFIYR